MVNDSDGSQYPTRATFVEVTEPARLVWTESNSGMTVTATFEDTGDGRTRVAILQTNVPAAFRAPEAQAGFLTSLDRFATEIRNLPPNAIRKRRS